MPTFIIEGYRFGFYSNEGTEPPHLHVSKGDMRAKVWLRTVEMANSKNIKTAQKKRVLKIIKENRNAFIQVWNNHFSK